MGVFASTFLSIVLGISQFLFLTLLSVSRIFGVVDMSSERNPWLNWMLTAVTLALFGVCVLGNLWLIKHDPRIKTIFLISMGVGFIGLLCSMMSLPAIIYKMGM